MTIAERLHEAVLETGTAGMTPIQLEYRMVEVFDDMEIDAAQLATELDVMARPAGLTPTTLPKIFRQWKERTETAVLERLHGSDPDPDKPLIAVQVEGIAGTFMIPADGPEPETMMESGYDPASERAYNDEQSYDIYADQDAHMQDGAA